MDSNIRIGSQSYPRSFLLDRENPSGQHILARARETKPDLFCMCTGTQLRMFVRKLDNGYTLIKQKGTGPDHHPDCPSVKEYDGYGQAPNETTKKDRTFGGVITRLQYEKSDNEDFQYLLHKLWLDAGFGKWEPYYRHDYFIQKSKVNLTLASAKIQWPEQNLADLLIIPDILNDKGRESHLGSQIMGMVKKHERNPILIARVDSVTASRYSHKVSLKDMQQSLWMRTDDFNVLSHSSGFQLCELVKPAANVFGIFEVWVSEKGNIQCSTAGLMACTSNGLPYLSEEHLKIIATHMIERKSFTTGMHGFNDMLVSLNK